MPETILVVDDEVAVLNSVRLTLRSNGYASVSMCEDSREVLAILATEKISLVLLDLAMPHLRGEEVLQQIRNLHPDVAVIVITAESNVQTAVTCMKLGAFDYLSKPVRPDFLVATVRRALDHIALQHDNERLRQSFFASEVKHPENFRAIQTSHEGLLRIFQYIEAIAKSARSVLITGETGTGKELIARAIHASSERSGAFIAVNAGSLSDELFADTLFGHQTGAYTGADQPRVGMFAQADEGTLFLDEIGDLSQRAQVMLLRVLQEREYYPLGSDQPRPLRARVVTATRRDPRQLREDLFYRLRAYYLDLPPLRERLDDLPLLIHQFLVEESHEIGTPVPEVPPNVLEFLRHYSFPGNIRELQSMTFHAVAQQKNGQLQLKSFSDYMEPDLRPSLPTPSKESTSRSALNSLLASGEVLTQSEMQELDRMNILRALEAKNWKVGGEDGAAQLLAMKPTTLASRMKKYNLQRPTHKSETP